MLLTIFAATLAAVVIVVALASIGRRTLSRFSDENERLWLVVRGFHQDLVAYANSVGLTKPPSTRCRCALLLLKLHRARALG